MDIRTLSSNNLKKMTGKKLEVELKHGATWQDFTEKYNCTQVEFLEYLEKNLCSSAVQSIVRKLNQNSKKMNRNIRKSKNSYILPKLTLKEIEEKSRMITAEEEDMKKDLEQLKKDEKTLVNQIMEQEKIREEMISKKANLFDKLRENKKEIESLKSKILQIKENTEETFKQIASLKEDMALKKEELLEKKQRLEIVRNDIKQLEKISIFAYKDGEIELEKEGEEMELEIPTSWQDVFESLLHNKLLENFSIKQVKQLSKLLVLVEEMEVKEEIFEMTFEDQEMQEIYYQII